MDNNFVNSELSHFWHDISSLSPYTSFSNTLPQRVQRNSNMGIMIYPPVVSLKEGAAALKIEHLGLRSEIDQMWTSIQGHVREEF